MSNAATNIPYPGIPAVSDGAGGVVWVEINITHGACAYPITSSTTMGTGYETAVSDGKQNLWGDTITFVQPVPIVVEDVMGYAHAPCVM